MPVAEEQIAQHIRCEINLLPVQMPARVVNGKSKASATLGWCKMIASVPDRRFKEHWQHDGGTGDKPFPKCCIY